MYASVPFPSGTTALPAKTYAAYRLPVGTVREPNAEYRAGAGIPRYEPEGSDRRAFGSVSVTPDAHWAASLTVPIPDADVAFIHVERHGPLPPDYRGSEESAELSIPIAEVEALAALLTGITAHARRDGVLP
jgi:hypothetical protein